MITSYKNEFSNLLTMRFNYSLRTMKLITLTDERKYVLRNVLHTCFENSSIDGSVVFREMTKYVFENIMY